MVRIKEWLSEFKPHLVTDGEVYAIRRRRPWGCEYLGNGYWHFFDVPEHCFYPWGTCFLTWKRLTQMDRIQKVDPARLAKGEGER